MREKTLRLFFNMFEYLRNIVDLWTELVDGMSVTELSEDLALEVVNDYKYLGAYVDFKRRRVPA